MGSISKNCLGWAARDTSGVLSPYNFIRRDTGPDHASLTITHCRICYADVAWAKNIPRNTIYPVVPGYVCHLSQSLKMYVFKIPDNYQLALAAPLLCARITVYAPMTTHRYVFKIPDNYQLVLATPLLCAGITVYAPMMRHKVNKPGKSLGVVGSGALGHLAVKFGKAFGLHVTVFCTSNSKKDEALNLLGEDKFIISSNMQQMEDLNNFLDRSSHDTLSESDVQKGKAWIMQLLAVACLSLVAKMEEIEVPLSVDLQVEECKFIFEAKTIQRTELLVLSTLKWRMRVVTPFTFMDYFFCKNNDDLPPPSSQISRLVELILRLTRGIEYLEFNPSDVAAVVSIYVIRETNVDKYEPCFIKNVQKVNYSIKLIPYLIFLLLSLKRDFKCLELIHELQRSATVQSVSQNPIGVLDVSCLSYKNDELPTVLSANPSQADSDFKRVNLNKPSDMD
ncbi:hypothetical protein GIB67_029547 [Kingdonia uniflora]|uniref:Cyclin N-terminal domain-containing protein n=1 Tax=Kingdonia uniflora TaxID=39325 RepID=A0A7J7NY76_9MAGN|nr:hypothetical protein GIB67_029547 [Kingdonia uniflora]